MQFCITNPTCDVVGERSSPLHTWHGNDYWLNTNNQGVGWEGKWKLLIKFFQSQNSLRQLQRKDSNWEPVRIFKTFPIITFNHGTLSITTNKWSSRSSPIAKNRDRPAADRTFLAHHCRSQRGSNIMNIFIAKNSKESCLELYNIDEI